MRMMLALAVPTLLLFGSFRLNDTRQLRRLVEVTHLICQGLSLNNGTTALLVLLTMASSLASTQRCKLGSHALQVPLDDDSIWGRSASPLGISVHLTVPFTSKVHGPAADGVRRVQISTNSSYPS